MTTPTSRVRRLGAAIVNPRAALALGGDRRESGRAGSDLLAAFGLLLLASQLVAIASAIWLAVAVDVGVGMRALLQVIAAFTVPLAVLVVATAVIFAGGGSRREVGRAFDLACVALVPLVVVVIVASALLHVAAVAVPIAAVSAVGYGWTCVMVVLAVLEARGTAPPPLANRRARVAGLAFVAVALAGAAAQVLWIARHTDEVRPMKSGAQAPELALHEIASDHGQGPVVSLARLRGHIVVVDFWATWCNPCLRALPRLAAFANVHSDVEVIAVAMDDPEGARDLFDAKGYRHRIELVLDDGATSARFGVSTIPHTVVIDRDGVVRAVSRGAELDLEQAIAAIHD